MTKEMKKEKLTNWPLYKMTIKVVCLLSSIVCFYSITKGCENISINKKAVL
jgi:hypothetical protein